MASFLTNKPQEFNEYVPKYDLQTYMAIATNKQQKRDENIELIQRQYDQVMGYTNPLGSIETLEGTKAERGRERPFATQQGGGLDILKDSEREYLREKQMEIYKGVQEMTKGEFSSQKLFARAEGLINSVYTDERIQRAVSSTRAKRQQDLDREELRKKDPNLVSVDNDFFMQLQWAEYLNSDDPNAMYSQTSYIPYYDLMGETSKFLRNMEGITRIEQTPIGDGGDPSTFGLTAYALNEHGVEKELSPERIRQVVSGFISGNPQAMQQMNISSTYFAYHTQDDHALQMATQSYQVELERTNYEIEATRMAIENSDSPDVKEYYNNRIEELDMYREGLISNIDRVGELFMSNPLEAKKRIFENNFMNTLSNTFQTKREYTKQVENIYGNRLREDEWKWRNYELELAKEQRKRAESSSTEKEVQSDFDPLDYATLGVQRIQTGESVYKTLNDELLSEEVRITSDMTNVLYNFYLDNPDTQEKARELFEVVQDVADKDGNIISAGGVRIKEGMETIAFQNFEMLVNNVYNGTVLDEEVRNAVFDIENSMSTQRSRRNLVGMRRGVVDAILNKQGLTDKNMFYTEDGVRKSSGMTYREAFYRVMSGETRGMPQGLINSVNSIYRQQQEKIKVDTDRFAKYAPAYESVSYIIPLNDKDKTKQVSQIKTLFSDGGVYSTEGRDFQKWREFFESSESGYSSGNPLLLGIVKRGSEFYLSSNKSTLKEIPIPNELAVRIDPSLVRQDGYERERKALIYNTDDSGRSALQPVGFDPVTNRPNGFVRKPTADLEIPLVYNITGQVGVGGQKNYKLLLYIPTQNGWKQYDTSGLGRFNTVDEALDFVNYEISSERLGLE